MTNTEAPTTRKKGNYWKVKPYTCTLFLRKKNRPVVTFLVDTTDEVGVKYTFILKWYAGSLDGETFDNIKDFLFEKWKLNKNAIAFGEKFDEKYRILITNK